MPPPPPDGRKHKRPVGAGLSLDKFASLGVSKYDKRKKLERIQKQKVIQHSKYSKLKKKLEAQGILSGRQVKDRVAELEALEGHGTQEASDEPSGPAARAASHALAGPRTQPPQERKQRSPLGKDEPAPQQDEVTAEHEAALLLQVPKRGSADRQQQDGALGAAGSGKKRPAPDSHAPKDSQRPSHKQRVGGPAPKSTDDEGGGDEAAGGSAGAEARNRKGGPPGASRAKAWGRGGDQGPRDDGEGHQGKKLSQLQRLALKVAEEKAEQQRAKEAAMKERQERLARIAAVEKERKEQKHLYFKRTAKGQPLMRYRMEKLLDKIQQGA